MMKIKECNRLNEDRLFCYSCGKQTKTYVIEINMDYGALHDREYLCKECLKKLKSNISDVLKEIE